MDRSEEKKHRTIALVVATGFQALLLLLFFFLIAWREPDPPLPEYGIELDFGLDTQGSGETPQPEPAPVEEEATEEPTETETEEVAKPEVVEPEPEPVPEVIEPEPEVVEEVVEAEVAEPEPEPVAEVPTETQPEESPVAVEEVEESPKEVMAEPKPTPKKESPKEVVAEPKPEPKPTPKEESLYPGGAAKSSNQGDDANEVGDKGKEDGTIDKRAIYGARGSADGASLQMAGWNWDNIPKPNDSSNENGRIVFEITIDDQGEIIGVRTVEKTVSPTVERQYRRAVEQLTFSTTSNNVRPAPTSTGRITFIIRAK